MDAVLNRINAIGNNNAGLLAIIAIVLTLLTMFSELPVWAVAPAAVLGLWAAVFVVRVLKRRIHDLRRPTFPCGRKFPGLLAAELTRHAVDRAVVARTIERSSDVENLASALFKTASLDQVLVITGPSGAGKSVLLEMIAGSLEASGRALVHQVTFGGGGNDLDKLRDAIRLVEAPRTKEVVLFLDQFELCVDQVFDEREGLQSAPFRLRDALTPVDRPVRTMAEGLSNLMQLKAHRKDFVIGVVVRSDRYYDLRILRGYVPSLDSTFEVAGFTDPEDLRGLRERLKTLKLTGEAVDAVMADLREPDGSVLPVKAAIVGCMLELVAFETPVSSTSPRPEVPTLSEDPRRRIDGAFITGSGGVDGLTESFFQRVTKSSPSSDIASALMYVLAIEGRVRYRFDLATLASMIFRDDDELLETLDHLKTRGVITVSGDQYAFAHDYLAQRFNELSGRMLVPVVRDNLAYSYAATINRRCRPGPVPRLGSTWSDRTWAVVTAKLVLAGTLAARLFWLDDILSGPLKAHVPFAGQLGATLPPTETLSPMLLDWQFLPIAAIQLCWGWYAIDVVAAIFDRIDRSPVMVLLSRILVLLVFVGMVGTILAPHLWLVCVAGVGMAVGVKFCTVGIEIRSVIGPNRFSLIGFYTIVNSLLVMYIGTLIFADLQWDLYAHANVTIPALVWSVVTLAPAAEHLRIYYVVIPLLGYFGYMYRAHVGTGRAVEFVGLYARVLSSKPQSVR